MLDYEVALSRLLSEVDLANGAVVQPLIECFGRVLANDYQAQYDSPQFDNSAMDGYALCDLSGEKTEFSVIARITAGDAADFTLSEGEAARIFTGAPIPINTTTVVMQEHTEIVNDKLVLTKKTAVRKNIRYQGEEIKTGSVLLQKGHFLDPAAIALSASQGFAELSVIDDLSITVFSTGDELIEPAEVLSPNKIYDANRYQLLAWLSGIAKPCDGGILPDSYEATKIALSHAVKNNKVIILSGGASVGEEDHVKRAITDLGELTAWKLAIKPGKPFGWGKIGDCTIFMLPGNPVATYVTFYLLVYPVLLKALGRPADLPQLAVKANFTKDRLEPRREFLRGTYYQNDHGGYSVDAISAQGSSMLSGLSSANCLIEVLQNTTVNLGDTVRIFPLP